MDRTLRRGRLEVTISGPGSIDLPRATSNVVAEGSRRKETTPCTCVRSDSSCSSRAQRSWREGCINSGTRAEQGVLPARPLPPGGT